MAGAPEAVTAETSPARSATTVTSDWSAVAAAVRKRMKALEITAVRLARNTGLSEATIRGIRAGTASPRPDTLARLSRGLGWPDKSLANVAAGKDYLPTHGLLIGDVIARIDARLERVESMLDRLIRALDTGPPSTTIGRGAYGDASRQS